MLPRLKMHDHPAVVVLSGGQDSVTCLGVALNLHPSVFAIGFEYGQRHAIELECAQNVCDMHGVPFKRVSLPFMADLVTSALTTKDKSVNEKHERLTDLPASFVPNRNALFLTLAHAHAQEVGAKTIYTGVCETDYSGYPDCREEFIFAFGRALNKGYQADIDIETPLMFLTKGETFILSEQVGFLDAVINNSHTCYNGNHSRRWVWGYGCGECPACILRSRGYEEYLQRKAGTWVEA